MLRTVKLVCAVAFLVGGCGKKADPKVDPKADPGPGSAPVTAKSDPVKPDPAKPDPEKPAAGLVQCSLLTVAEATASLGAPAKYTSDTPMNPEVSDCELTTTTDTAIGKSVTFGVRPDGAEYDAAVAAEKKAEPVTGIGDKAAWLPSEILPRLVVMTKGRTMFVLQTEAYGKPGSKDVAIDIAKKILAHL